jgi:hypothetical protein
VFLPSVSPYHRWRGLVCAKLLQHTEELCIPRGTFDLSAMDRKRTPVEIETSVLVKSARRCTLCFHLSCDLREKRGQIAHLDKDPSNSAEDNLAFMCLDHHTLYDSKTGQHKNYTIREAKIAREQLYEAIRQNRHAVSSASGAPVAESESQRKLRKILPWKAKIIKHSLMSTGNAVNMVGSVMGSSYVQLFDCTDSFVTVGKTGIDGYSTSIALADIEIGFDNTRHCLELQERHA